MGQKADGQGGGGSTITHELPLTARRDILAVWARERRTPRLLVCYINLHAERALH